MLAVVHRAANDQEPEEQGGFEDVHGETSWQSRTVAGGVVIVFLDACPRTAAAPRHRAARTRAHRPDGRWPRAGYDRRLVSVIVAQEAG